MLGSQETSMKSIRPYRTSEQYLYAMKEDLAEWLKDLYHLNIQVESFLDVLETGVLLCHHANTITQLARDLSQEYPGLSHAIQLPTHGVTCNDFAQPGTFQARDNVSNFIQWCRQEMAIQDVLMFETDDLVLRKNEKNFVLCLLEVARRASRFGMQAPILIQMEEEIEDEIREELKLPPEETPLPKPQRKAPDFKNLDQMVQHFVSRCTCPVQFSMTKVSEGKYRVGDSNTLIFVRILRKHVMVRVGGGWDTLENYLDKHDPCRCTSLSHKQALKMAGSQKTQATQVQHEITTRLTPGTDHPSKPQPAIIVRRSQSPLPLVEWRTYVPHSVSMGRKVPSSQGPNQNSSNSRRKMEGQCNLRDPSEPRGKEQSATPLRRSSAADDRPGSKQTFLTQSRRGMFCGSFSSQQNGNMENHLLGSKGVPELRPGRTARSIQMTAASQIKKPENATSPGTPGQKAGASLASGFQQMLKLRPSTPTHSNVQQTREVPTSGHSSVAHQEGVPTEGLRKAPKAGRSFSPVKQMHSVQKEESSAKGSAKVRLTFSRPPTPSKNYEARNGGGLMTQVGVLKGGASPQKEEGKASNGFPERSWVGLNQVNLEHQRKNVQTNLDQRGAPHSPCENDQSGHGDIKEPPVEKERVYTPLPINVAEEQALYRSLEEEIMANIKELEDGEDENHLSKESQLRGFRMDRDSRRGTAALDCNDRRLSTPSLPFWSNATKVLDYREGVPRSGVYVPESETKWHPAGPCYEAVIRELSMALHQDHVGREGLLPTPSSSLEGGKSMPKKVLERDPPREEKQGSPQTGEDKPSPSMDEGEPNGDATQATLSTATSSAESFATLESVELLPSKPRRSLKKPERVPSIYKLKLRPKIRPRRDHRPEKKPSKIPTPVAYRHLRRTSSLKSQPKPPPKSLAKPREKETLNSSAEGQNEVSSTHCEERTTAEEEAGVSDDEESWV
ncbi:GAS2-like protein 2 [Pogona vitticeps]